VTATLEHNLELKKADNFTIITVNIIKYIAISTLFRNPKIADEFLSAIYQCVYTPRLVCRE